MKTKSTKINWFSADNGVFVVENSLKSVLWLRNNVFVKNAEKHEFVEADTHFYEGITK